MSTHFVGCLQSMHMGTSSIAPALPSMLGASLMICWTSSPISIRTMSALFLALCHAAYALECTASVAGLTTHTALLHRYAKLCTCV